MAIKTREELEQELEDIKSRLSVIETSQKTSKEDNPSDEPEDKSEVDPEDESKVESEDEIEKLLNS